MAKLAGGKVITVTSTANLDLVTSLGAEIILQKTSSSAKSGMTSLLMWLEPSSFSRCKHKLADNGRFIAVAGGLADMLSTLWTPLVTGKKVIAGAADEKVDDVLRIAELAAKGDLKSVTDRIYPFSQMIKAHAYVGTSRKRGAPEVRP